MPLLVVVEDGGRSLHGLGVALAQAMSAIAKELGLSVSRVSRLIARLEEAKGKTCPCSFSFQLNLSTLILL